VDRKAHERPADPAEAADRPLEPKSSDGQVSEGGTEPGAGPSGPRPDPPHHDLDNPAEDPDPTADSDPYGSD